MHISDGIEFTRDKRNAVLITQRANARPQSSNITYVLDDDDRILISLTADRAKTKNLQRTPMASLHVNRDDFWAYVVLDANVTLSPIAERIDDDTVERLVDYYRRVAGEHDDWEAFRTAMVEEGRLIATLTPTHAYGMIRP
ncbi:MAG: PPOX class F420-dependent oxidoreductase [Ilumatobacter sp.]